MANQQYDGWRNKETELVHNLLIGSKSKFRFLQHAVTTYAADLSKAAYWLEHKLAENHPHTKDIGMWDDLAQTCFWNVDFNQIVEKYRVFNFNGSRSGVTA